MYRNKMVSILLGFILTMSALVSPVSAADNGWAALKERLEVSCTEPWVLDLQTELPDSVLAGAVVEKNNEFLPVTIQKVGTKLTMIPAKPYEANTKYNLRLFTDDGKRYMLGFTTKKVAGIPMDGTKDVLIKIEANPAQGFHWPYLLFIPKDAKKNTNAYLLVEPNNTGYPSDDMAVHEKAARELAESGAPRAFANGLNVPLLIPIIPRPDFQYDLYTHALNRGTLLSTVGEYKRIDLQLISMIDNARARLSASGIATNQKVFMSGYSASGQYINRFAVLHPERVRAIASGGFNSLPLLPADKWKGFSLRYPIGVADIKELTGKAFNSAEYMKVSQYLYMGYLDKNDAVEYRDSFEGQDADLIVKLFEKDLMKRWESIKGLYKTLGVNAQLVTYNGTNHEIKSEMIEDIIAFFKGNSSNEIVHIKPHQYTFIENRQHKTVTINNVLWKGSNKLPEWSREHISQQGDFFLSISEWFPEQDHQQMNEFFKNAGINLTLKAKGQADIVITEQNYRGSMFEGSGNYQGFVIKLNPGELEKMASNIPYTIHPNNKSTVYGYKVKPGVVVIKP